MTQDAAALYDLIAGFFQPHPPERLAVAVSGGSDSLGLLVLLNDWRLSGGADLHAVTVDHGLRPESAAEAAQVARTCEMLGLPHQILIWKEWDGQGNLPDQARRARYRLMADWAEALGIADIAVGHTADDQAETFLMRLARESGVDGLAAMAPDWRQGKVRFCRPTLRATRAELRQVLRARNLSWVEDPSNDNPAYARVRARAAMAALEPLGITAEGLSSVAQHMTQVRQTLYGYASEAAQNLVVLQKGDLLIDRAGFLVLPTEVSRRLLQSALKWVSGAEYGPRGRALDLLMTAIRNGNDMTLSGCLVTIKANQLRLAREFNAVAQMRCPVSEVWDNRWHVTGPATDGVEVAALGMAGLRQCPEWRESGLPDASLMASPAIWRGGELLAAPVAGLENGWRAELTAQSEENLAKAFRN